MSRANLDLRKLIISALGIVYGDIGTSPLYTFKECINTLGIQSQHLEILGILSLIFWSILIVICIKYAIFVLRADNEGEGGTLALTALLHQYKNLKHSRSLIFLGMLGAALFCGDGLITPAISVLGALEGLVIVSPQFDSLILPLTVAVLICIFLAQKHGTAKIGVWFGPIMTVWFLVIGALGLVQIVQNPFILKALNPLYGIYLLANNGLSSLLILGTTVLALTGAEAMYADLGHFGKKPIRIAWFYLVCPSLLLNYFGQAALLLNNPGAIENPFYLLAPSWGLYPLITLATMATIIASQSIISGIFSIGWQALQLGYLPKLQVLHTSAKQIGQVYIPSLNTLLMISTILLVLIFKSSSHLAAAYGLVVSSIMLMTSILITMVARYFWKWKIWKISLIFSPLIVIDAFYFFVNLTKILHGGWLPLLIALGIYAIMHTWYQCKQELRKEIKRNEMSLDNLLKITKDKKITRKEGTAIYITSIENSIPIALNVGLFHYKVLHDRIILLTVTIKNTPTVNSSNRLIIKELSAGIYQINAYYGFIERPNISKLILKFGDLDIGFTPDHFHCFIGRIFPTKSPHTIFKNWKKQIFDYLSKNEMNPTEFYHIPAEHAVELVTRVKV